MGSCAPQGLGPDLGASSRSRQLLDLGELRSPRSKSCLDLELAAITWALCAQVIASRTRWVKFFFRSGTPQKNVFQRKKIKFYVDRVAINIKFYFFSLKNIFLRGPKVEKKSGALGNFFFRGGPPRKKKGPGPGKMLAGGVKKLIFGVIFRFAKNNAENHAFCSINSLCTKKTGICQLRPKMAKSVILKKHKNNSWNLKKPAIFFMFLSLYFFSCNFKDRKRAKKTFLIKFL